MTRFGLVLVLAICIGVSAGIVFAQGNAANGGTDPRYDYRFNAGTEAN